MKRILHAIHRQSGNLCVIFAIVLIALVSASCVGPPKTPVSEESYTQESIEVDPVFRAYYSYLGGETVLGPAISPSFQEGNTTYQYVENGKMAFNPGAPAISHFRMAPLGLEMKVEEPPIPEPTQPGLRYVDGHTIHPDFLPLYEKLGTNTVGRPLTELRYNPVRKRYEQFFENLGFYRREGTNEIGLLAYGAWVCDENCRKEGTVQSAVMDIQNYIDPIFQAFVDNKGADFTGFALTDMYMADDGKKEQILENVVVVEESPEKIDLRPLAEKLSIFPELPREYSGNSDMFFYEIGDGKGYEIPNFFLDYIYQHGGFETFGPPITHYAPLFGLAYHQCFAKLCLSYEPTASEGARIRPEPLGYAYKVLYYDGKSIGSAQPTSTPSPGSGVEILLEVWVSYPAIATNQSQEIGGIVFLNDNPVPDVLLSLDITLPDGTHQDYNFPPTDVKGQTKLRLPPIDASNGTLIPYKVCIDMQGTNKFCVRDNFVIWNNP